MCISARSGVLRTSPRLKSVSKVFKVENPGDGIRARDCTHESRDRRQMYIHANARRFTGPIPLLRCILVHVLRVAHEQ